MLGWPLAELTVRWLACNSKCVECGAWCGVDTFRPIRCPTAPCSAFFPLRMLSEDQVRPKLLRCDVFLPGDTFRRPSPLPCPSVAPGPARMVSSLNASLTLTEAHQLAGLSEPNSVHIPRLSPRCPLAVPSQVSGIRPILSIGHRADPHFSPALRDLTHTHLRNAAHSQSIKPLGLAGVLRGYVCGLVHFRTSETWLIWADSMLRISRTQLRIPSQTLVGGMQWSQSNADHRFSMNWAQWIECFGARPTRLMCTGHCAGVSSAQRPTDEARSCRMFAAHAG